MGIYIKGMDRVSDCMYCLFYSHGYCNAKHGRCNSEFGIDADCPLVEVKTPHGRLIDADKTWACVLEQVENMPPELEITEREKGITLAVISGLIVQMPTVIEAEVE